MSSDPGPGKNRRETELVKGFYLNLCNVSEPTIIVTSPNTGFNATWTITAFKTLPICVFQIMCTEILSPLFQFLGGGDGNI